MYEETDGGIIIKKIDLSDFKQPGESTTRRYVLTQVAESVNESEYTYPGPGGYLSPSTISAWMGCPRAVLYGKFEKIAPFRGKLVMAAGNGVHKGAETVYKKLQENPAATIDAEEIVAASVDEFE